MATQIKLIVGLLFTLLTCIPLAVVAYNDLGTNIDFLRPTQGTVMQARAAAFHGREIEVGADLYSQYCTICHGNKGEGVLGVAPALNRKDLLDGRYTKQIAWASSSQTFLQDTIAAGRPVQSRPDLYAVRMPTWSNAYGGPLRPDQVDALVSFMMNWKDKAPEVDAWPPPGTPRPTPTRGPSPTPRAATAGLLPQCEDVPAVFKGKTNPYRATDAAALGAGKQTFEYQCAACHGLGGRGDGVAAAALNPKPASFADKNFMSGLPVDCHFWRVSEGVTGTGMPPWKALGEDAIWKVILYERSFNP